MAVERDERSSVAKEFTLAVERDERSSVAKEFIYLWHDLFRANENESKTSLVRLLGVKQTKNKN